MLKGLIQTDHRFTAAIRAVRPAMAAIAVLGVAVACASPGSVSRVVARSGETNLGPDTPGFNFSMALPEGWELTESLELDSEALVDGWLRHSVDLHEISARWSSGDHWDDAYLSRAREQENAVVEDLSIEGSRLRIVYVDPTAPGGGHSWFGAVFDSLPGTPADGPDTSLSFTSGSAPAEEIDTLIGLVKTVRYVKPPATHGIPVTPLPTDEDWMTLAPEMFDGWSDGRSTKFEVMAPDGTTAQVRAGYDTLVFTIQVGDVLITGERGQAGGIVGPPDPEPGTIIWRKDIAGADGFFWQKALDDGTYEMGAFYPVIPGYSDTVTINTPTATVLIADAVPSDQRAKTLAVLESVRYAE